MRINLLKIRNKVVWHKWPLPKDITILSIYEVIAYIIAFAVCFYVYNLLQIVPVQEDSIYRRININRDKNSTTVGGASLSYYIPMSYVLNCNKPSVTLRQDPNGHGINTDISKIEKYERDRLSKFLYSKLPDSINREELCDINYVRYKLKHNINSFIGINYNHYGKPDCDQDGWHKDFEDTTKRFVTAKAQIKDNIFTEEWYGPRQNSEFKIGDGAFSLPSLWSPYDISQSYYKLHFEGEFEDLDSIKYDFEGAIDISNIYPEPDKLTMNSILYINKAKINEIIDSGLSFHVKFVELENYQNMRLFFITALLSALFAIFITFIILSIYKGVIVKIIENKK